MKKLSFQISGTHCPACKKLIEKRVSGIPGVKSINVVFETGETEIISENILTKVDIQKVLEGMEYVVL